MRTGEGPTPAWRLDGEGERRPGLRHARGPRVHEEGDAAAKAPEHLAELEADVAAAENQELAGQRRHVHQRRVRVVSRVAEPGNVRGGWSGAGVDEDPFALVHVAGDLD